jgi:hypothetical protein
VDTRSASERRDVLLNCEIAYQVFSGTIMDMSVYLDVLFNYNLFNDAF